MQSVSLAQTVYWAANPDSPTPTGTWDATTAAWSTDSSGANMQTWLTGASAYFSAGSGGTGTFTVAVSGTQTAGGLTLNTGALTFSGGTVALQGGSAINIANGSSLVFGSALGGTSGFTFAGNNTGSMRLTGSGNAIGGNVAVNSGTLTFAGSGAFSSGTTLSVATGATLQMSSVYTNINNTTLTGTGTLNVNTGWLLGNNGTLSSFAGTIKISGSNNYLSYTQGFAPSSSATLDVGAGTKLYLRENSTTSIGSTITGSGTLVRDVAGGLVTLTNPNNSFTGLLSLNTGGTLTITNGGSLGSAAVAFGTGGGTVNFNNASQTLTGLNTAGSSGTVNLSNATTLTMTEASGQNDTFAGVIAGGGAVVKAGSGTLSLTGLNNYSGGMTLNSGVVNVSAGASVGSGPLTMKGGTLNLNTASQSVSALNGTGGVIALGLGSTLVDNAVGADTFAGVLQGAGNLTKSGSGSLTLTGANTYTGNTVVNNGTLTVGAGGALGGGSLAVNGGTLNFKNGSQSVSSLSGSGGAVNLESGTTLTDNTTATATFAGLITGEGNLLKSGNGTLILSGANTYTGSTTVAGGMLTVSANSAAGTGALTVNSGVVNLNNATQSVASLNGTGGTVNLGAGHTLVTTTGAIDTFAGILEGTGSLQMAGTGTLELTGANTYTGTTTLAKGILSVGSGSALGNTGEITFAGGTLRFNSGNTNDYSGRIADSSASIKLDTNGQSVVFAGNLAGSNVGGLAKLGIGTLTLTGSNAQTGTTVVSAGDLIVSGADAKLSAGTAGLVMGGGNLTLENNAQTIASLSGSAGVIELGSNHMLTLQGGGTYGGVISGRGGMTLAADGATMTLGGSSDNLNSGVTRINAGMLALAKSGGAVAIGGGDVELAGGTLRFEGSQEIARAATLTLGGGTLELNNMTQAFGTALHVNGNAVIDFGAGGGGALSFASSAGTFWSGTLTLVNFSDSSRLRFGTDASGLNATQIASIAINGFSRGFGLDANGYLTLTAVPEPSTYAMLFGVAATGAALWSRRRQRIA
ncbi:MAG: autotransporter-associated beta strand repeat-containing protein [Verrucomicrobia bacterium]|nr:autotransporter-associated beta strand repeat-containing protein [Verrucomicrobiota bacterium]